MYSKRFDHLDQLRLNFEEFISTLSSAKSSYKLTLQTEFNNFKLKTPPEDQMIAYRLICPISRQPHLGQIYFANTGPNHPVSILRDIVSSLDGQKLSKEDFVKKVAQKLKEANLRRFILSAHESRRGGISYQILITDQKEVKLEDYICCSNIE